MYFIKNIKYNPTEAVSIVLLPYKLLRKLGIYYNLTFIHFRLVHILSMLQNRISNEAPEHWS